MDKKYYEKAKELKVEIDHTETIFRVSKKAYMEGLKIVFSSPYHFKLNRSY